MSEFFSFCQAYPLYCSVVNVLEFQIIAKTTLDAAGLQASEVEADASSQLFTRLQLDHKTGVLSLEASRIWRLRSGLEHASRQRHLPGTHVAKFFLGGTCCVVLPCLSSMLGVVKHIRLDPEADGCGPPLRKSFDGSRHC